MITKKRITDALDLASSAVVTRNLELVVGWRVGRGWAGANIPIAPAVEAGLLEACRNTLVYARQIEHPKQFDVDTAIGPGEMMVADAAGFPDADPQGKGETLLGLLNKPTVGQMLKPSDLKGAHAQKINFYAVRAQAPDDTAGSWVVFLNRTDPQVSARPGSFLVLFGEDRLDSLEGPVFQFRRSFDMILASGLVLTTGFASFDILFRQVIEEQVADMVDELVTRLPSNLPLDSASAAILKHEGRTRPRLRTRLRALLAKPYLKNLTIKAVRAEAKRQRMKSAEFLQNGMLFVDPKRPTHLVNLLDEALVRGGFSGDLFEVEHRARVE